MLQQWYNCSAHSIKLQGTLKGIAWNIKMLLLLCKEYFPETFCSHLTNICELKLIHFMPFSFCSGMRVILCPLVTFRWSWKVISKCPASSDMGTLFITVIFITSYLLNCHASCIDFVAIVYRKSHIYLLHQHYVYHAFSCTAMFGRCVSFFSHC